MKEQVANDGCDNIPALTECQTGSLLTHIQSDPGTFHLSLGPLMPGEKPTLWFEMMAIILINSGTISLHCLHYLAFIWAIMGEHSAEVGVSSNIMHYVQLL